MNNWIIQKFLLGWLKEQLGKIPGDGIKTVLGLLLIVLGVLAKACLVAPAMWCAVVPTLTDLLGGLDPAHITDAGIVALVVGVVHKLLKLFSGEKQVVPQKLELTKQAEK